MKKVFEVKYNTFFIIFKGLSVAKNCLKPENAPLKFHSRLPVTKTWNTLV